MSGVHEPKKKSGTIKVDYMARVEGEGALFIKLKNDQVQDVKLKIFEPPRLFEALLQGRHFSEAPDITARICGICPIAYQMSSVHAIERALAVNIHPMVRLLRRLLYAGEWIESHVLHIYMLHAPDFLGYRDFVELAKDHPSEATEALRLKKLGNHIMTLLGGREIHPVSVTVGGFYKTPSKADLQKLTEELKWALDVACKKLEFLAGFEYPDFEQTYEFVALSHPNEYPLNEGRLVSNKGLNIDASQYEDYFVEQHIKHSNALHSVIRGRGSYQVGSAGAIQFELLEASRSCAAGVRALRLAGALPESVQEHSGARGRSGIRDPGIAAHRPNLRAASGAQGVLRSSLLHRLLHHRSAARHPVQSLLDRRARPDPASENRAADFAESKAHRRRSSQFHAVDRHAAGRRNHAPLRAGGSQLRSLHFVRDAFPEAHDLERE